MEDVKTALENFATARKADEIDSRASSGPLPDFADVASAWSSYCCHNLRGDLLKLGLNIACALSEFDRGLKYPETLND